MSDLDPNEATTSTDLDRTTAVPVTTAPLTPTTPGTDDPTPQPYEPAVAWAPAVPVVATKPDARRTAPLGGRVAVVALVLAASAAVAALITGSSPKRPSLGLRPGATPSSTARSASTCPATSVAPSASSSRSSRASRTRPRSTRKLDEVLDQLVKERLERRPDLHHGHQAVVRRRGRLQRRAAAARQLARGPTRRPPWRRPARSRCSRSRTRQRPRPGSTRRSRRAARRRPTETYNGATLTILDRTATDRRPPSPCSAARSRSSVTSTSVKAAVDTKGNSGFASEPGPKAALGAADRRPRRLRVRRAAAAPRLVHRLGARRRRPTPAASPRAALSGSLAKVVPDWAAYWLRFEKRRGRHGGGRAEARDAHRPDREPHVRRSPSTSRRARSSWRSATTSAPTLRQRRSTLYARTRRSRRCSTSSTRASVSSAAGTAALGWIGDTGHRRQRSRTGRRKAGSSSCPTDKAAAEPAVHRPAHVHRARWRRPGASRSARRPTPAPRSRSSTSAISASSSGRAAPRVPTCRCRPANSRSPMP